jgi:hypothetical protein
MILHNPMRYTLRHTLAGILAAFLAAGAALSFGSGCAAHVNLGRVPDASAALEERADAYDRLRPRVAAQTRMATWGAHQDLVLNGGVVVEDPTDLSHVVAPGTATNVHADRADQDEMLSNAMFGAGAVLAVVAASAGAAELIALAAPPPPNSIAARAMPGVGYAGLVSGVAAGFAMIPAGFAAVAASQERTIAFTSYDADLRARLALVAKKPPEAERQAAAAAKWDGE